ncbi:unnamed protein product [Cyprideis torosa]|uniref:Uncharacterized protein n=1 Tax=Cyprideis torosa TaxID=163714 RepID=A0A7R8ZHS0_9CRUS|nr:unnamed protein product [Cyprideis torosa]CAG0884381.1 unnamed protein product [Cyprideis torosa]
MLTIGVILVQWKPDAATNDELSFGDQAIGFICVLIAVFTSGYAGVYYEKLVKVGPVHLTSIPLRNTQLGFFSVAFAFGGMVINDWERIRDQGMLHHYNVWVWIVILLLSTGGLLVAATLKYADNILKGFATSISIILSSLISMFILKDLQITWTFAIGTLLVMVSTFLYSRPPPQIRSQRLNASQLQLLPQTARIRPSDLDRPFEESKGEGSQAKGDSLSSSAV